MARVVLCDRCGSMGFAGALGAVILQTTLPEGNSPAEETVSAELCPSCVGDIVAAIESTEVEPSRVPFRSPWRRDAPEEGGPARPALESAG